MAHFAKIKNNVVTEVIVIDDSHCNSLEFPKSEPIGKEYIKSLGYTGEWVQTSYNNNFRKNYAGVGYEYDKIRNAFIPPIRYPSWILNETTCQWEAPVPYPNNNNMYEWNETLKVWDLVNR